MQHSKRIAYLASAFALVAMAVMGTTNYSRYASATTSLSCTDSDAGGMDVTDEAPVPLGHHISCTSSTSNVHATHYQLLVTDGSGATVQNSGIQTGTSVSSTFPVTNEGVWHVTVLYFDDLGARVDQELLNLEVSFFVLPESPIGVAAIMGSSLAALGAFVGLRRHKNSV